MGRGIAIPHFGTFTFSAPDCVLDVKKDSFFSYFNDLDPWNTYYYA